MRLTPLDIKKQEFTRTLRGFDTEEVQAFLKTMADQWEDILDEHRRMEGKVREAEAKLEHYQRVEEALQEALHTARQSSRQALDNAEKQARLIIKEAEGEADDIKRQALRDRDKLEREASTLHERRDEIVARLRAFLASEVELLARFDGGDFLGARLLQSAAPQAQSTLPPGEMATAEFEVEASEVAFVPPVPDLSIDLPEDTDDNLFPPEEEVPEPAADATPAQEHWVFDEFAEGIEEAVDEASDEAAPEPVATAADPDPVTAQEEPEAEAVSGSEETELQNVEDEEDLLADAYLGPEEDESEADEEATFQEDETILLETPVNEEAPKDEPAETLVEAAAEAIERQPDDDEAALEETDDASLSFKFLEPAESTESFFHGDEPDPKFSSEGDGVSEEHLTPEEQESEASLGAGWLVQSMLSAANAATEPADDTEKIKASATNDEIEKIRRILNDLE